MKIQPIFNFNIKRNWTSSLLRRSSNNHFADSFERTINSMPKLEEITSETAKKMYGANFVPLNKNISGFIYPTFVLNQKNGKPVQVLVKPIEVNDYEEVYRILDKTGKNILGIRTFKIGKYEEVINPGFMQTYSQKYKGIGLRAHQIAIERMLMRNYDNVNIDAAPLSYNFHKSAGFSSPSEIVKVEFDYYNKVIDGICQDFQISKNKIKKLMAANNSSGFVYVDKYLSYENILKYLYTRNNKKLINECPLSLHMQLSEKALNEWKKLIDRSPIFIGKKFPTQLVKTS